MEALKRNWNTTPQSCILEGMVPFKMHLCYSGVLWCYTTWGRPFHGSLFQLCTWVVHFSLQWNKTASGMLLCSMVFDQMWHKRWCRGQLFILSHTEVRHGILLAWGALLTSLIWPPWLLVMRQDRLCTAGSQRRNSPSNSWPNVHVPTCFFCLTECVMVCEYI